MKVLRHRILSGVAYALGLLLVITPVVLPLVAIPHALARPPAKKVRSVWIESQLPWDGWAAALYYFSDPMFLVSSLLALAAGAWLLLSPLSWKNGLFALMVAIPWFLLVTLLCFHMLHGRSVFDVFG